MKLIGYWFDPDDDMTKDFPDPKDYVDSNWLIDERHHLVSYLCPDQNLGGQWGYSWCRFLCEVEDREMGSKLFTDGVWVWPEGLAHYIECHNVVLPDEFVSDARDNSWVIPELDESIFINDIDPSFWLEWTKR